MGIREFLTNFAETSERHSKNILRTRYYRTRYSKVKEAVVDYAKRNDFIVNSIDDKHGEIFVQTTKFHLIISILQINALETGVDVKVQTYKIIGLNKPLSVIEHLFSFLDSVIEFKGVGLHP